MQKIQTNKLYILQKIQINKFETRGLSYADTNETNVKRIKLIWIYWFKSLHLN